MTEPVITEYVAGAPISAEDSVIAQTYHLLAARNDAFINGLQEYTGERITHPHEKANKTSLLEQLEKRHLLRRHHDVYLGDFDDVAYDRIAYVDYGNGNSFYSIGYPNGARLNISFYGEKGPPGVSAFWHFTDIRDEEYTAVLTRDQKAYLLRRRGERKTYEFFPRL